LLSLLKWMDALGLGLRDPQDHVVTTPLTSPPIDLTSRSIALLPERRSTNKSLIQLLHLTPPIDTTRNNGRLHVNVLQQLHLHPDPFRHLPGPLRPRRFHPAELRERGPLQHKLHRLQTIRQSINIHSGPEFGTNRSTRNPTMASLRRPPLHPLLALVRRNHLPSHRDSHRRCRL
jgi:hypothetical protein